MGCMANYREQDEEREPTKIGKCDMNAENER
jgi:hypothetical protein